MEQYFASLSKRQTMLLLTAVTFGGNECVEALDHLPEEEAELLKHRANALLQIPRDKRIPFLVQEIKRLVTARRRQLASVDPARLAAVLGKERNALVEVVLRALPSQIADLVRKEVPGQPVKLQREVRPDVLSIIRWKLEEAIRGSAPKGSGSFKFTDLLVFQSRELLTIADRMGARALATAIAGLSDADRDTFFGALPPDQRSLAHRASEAGKARKLTEDDSKTVLEMHNALKEPSTGMRSAGAQRLARAALAQSPEFAARLIERNPGEFGKLLIRWTREERNKAVRGDGGRLDIVEQMERLAQRGVIDRPLRLPPPVMKPAPPPPSRSSPAIPAPAAEPLPGGRLMAPQKRSAVLGPPPEKRPAPGERRPTAAGGERRSPTVQPEALSLDKPARRDFMADRAARNAGAASSHLIPAVGRAPPERPPAERPQSERGPVERPRSARPPTGRPPPARPESSSRPVTDPNIKAAKIMRDGKELQRPPTAPKPRAPTSPALQEIPRRRNPPPGSAGSSILRDPGQTSASRGRGGGSR